MSKLVAGKLAFVTGAGSGIGREVCRVLAREGANVIAADRNIETAQETVKSLEGTGHVALYVQVADRESVESAFKDVAKLFSRAATIIVNSAGIVRADTLMTFNDNNFDDTMNVNLKGVFLIMQTAVKMMIEANATKDSSIINVSSILSEISSPELSTYGASKAGVTAMTKSTSTELGRFGVRVNAVLPNFIETPLIAAIPNDVRKAAIDRTSLQRVGKPEEVAEVIVFLASDRSSYVNGATIEITGGAH